MNYSNISTTNAWMPCSKQPSNHLILSERKSFLARKFSAYTQYVIQWLRDIAVKILENQACLLKGLFTLIVNVTVNV